MTSTQQNVYVDNLVDTVNKYNNPYHSTISDVNSNTYLVIKSEYQNIKTFLPKFTLQITLKKFCDKERWKYCRRHM